MELHAICNYRGQEHSRDSKPGLNMFNKTYKRYQNPHFESVTKPCVSGRADAIFNNLLLSMGGKK